MKNKIILAISFLTWNIGLSQGFDYYMYGPRDDSFVKSLEDSKSNYYILGLSNMSLDNTFPHITILDEKGIKIKEVLFDTLGYSYFQDMIWSNDSNLIVAGLIKKDSSTNSKPIIAKLDKNLNFIWIKYYTGLKPYTYFSRVKLSSDSTKYYLCGNSNNPDSNIYRGLTCESNLNGDQIIYKEHYLGDVLTLMFDIIETSDNKFLVPVLALDLPDYPNTYNGSNKLIRFDSDHTIDSVAQLTGQGVPSHNKIPLFNSCTMEWIDSNKLMIQGRVSNSTDTDPFDDDRDMGFLLFDYDNFEVDTTIPYGDDKLWDQPAIFGLSFLDTSSIYGVVTHNFDIPDKFPTNHKGEFYVVNVNSKGIDNWQKYYSNNAHLNAYGILATKDGGALITGYSFFTGYNGIAERDGYVLKIGSNGESTITPAGIVSQTGSDHSFKVYPNPSNGHFTVSLDGQYFSRLSIHNLLGELIYKEEIRSDEVVIRMNLLKGMYILTLENRITHVSVKLLIE